LTQLRSLADALPVALRSVARNRSLVAVAVVSLGLASAVTTTMFAVIDALAHPATLIPQPQSLREVRVSDRESRSGITNGDVYRALRSSATFPRGVVAEQWLQTAVLRTPLDQQIAAAARVTPNYFRLLGVSPIRGRVFGADDTPSRGTQAAVITEGMWNLLFGAKTDFSNAHISINDTSYAVVGVLPTSWRQLGFPSVLLSADSGAIGERSAEFVRIFARLDPGASAQSALAELSVLVSRLTPTGERLTPNRSPRVELVPLTTNVTGIAGLHWLLWIAALLILVIACANVATLLLVRGIRRRGELALRAALGAARRDLVVITLAETAVLASVSAALGFMLSMWLVRLATYSIPIALRPALGTPHINLRVFAFSIAAASLTVLVAGLYPALRTSGVNAIEALKDASASTSGRVAKNLRAFVIAELTLSFLLMVGVGFVARSIMRAGTIDYGLDFRGLYRTALTPWDASRVLLTAQQARPDSVRQAAYESEQRANLAMRAAVARAGVVRSAGTMASAVSVPQEALRVDTNTSLARLDRYSIVSTGFFETLGVRDDKGGLVRLDVSGNRPVAVVDEILAQRLWGSTNPRGHVVRLGGSQSNEPALAVVAVIRPFLLDVPAGAVPRRDGQLFVVDDTVAPQGTDLLIRASAHDRTNREQILAAMRAVAPRATFSRVALIESEHQLLVDRQRFVGYLAGAITALGVSLALVGLYAVVSFTVALRSREFAVRAALGAPPASVWLLVLRDGFVLVAFGGAAGVLLTLALRRVIASAFFGQGAASIDGPTIVATLAVLCVVSLAACLHPAHSAARARLATLLRAN
jgi:predicted permease